MPHPIRHFVRDETGASALEYGLIVGIIAVALVVALALLGGGTADLFGSVCENLPEDATCE